MIFFVLDELLRAKILKTNWREFKLWNFLSQWRKNYLELQNMGKKLKNCISNTTIASIYAKCSVCDLDKNNKNSNIRKDKNL